MLFRSRHEEKVKPEPPKPNPVIKVFDDNELIEEIINIEDPTVDPGDEINLDKLFINDEKPEPDDEIFVKVEQMPRFKKGGVNEFRNWVVTRLKFPQEAIDMGLSGRVEVKFIVDENGEVINAEIARGVDPLIDNEVLRVINGSPKWEPGKQREKPVKVSFRFSIVFQLRN